MTKQVLIQVKGIRTNRFAPEEEAEIVESITTGTYYKRNGSYYILYEECLGDVEDIVKNRVKIRPDLVEIVKTGSANTNMSFELGKKQMSLYKTIYGDMEVSTFTEIIQIEEMKDELSVMLHYELEINNEYSSDNQIEIIVKSNKYE